MNNTNNTTNCQINPETNSEMETNLKALIDLQSSMQELQEQANYALINKDLFATQGKIYSDKFKSTLNDIIMTDISDLNTLIANISPILQSDYLNSNEFNNELNSLLPNIAGKA